MIMQSSEVECGCLKRVRKVGLVEVSLGFVFVNFIKSLYDLKFCFKISLVLILSSSLLYCLFDNHTYVIGDLSLHMQV